MGGAMNTAEATVTAANLTSSARTPLRKSSRVSSRLRAKQQTDTSEATKTETEAAVTGVRRSSRARRNVQPLLPLASASVSPPKKKGKASKSPPKEPKKVSFKLQAANYFQWTLELLFFLTLDCAPFL